MKRWMLIFMLNFLACTVQAEWLFSDKLDVAPQNNGNKTFHHLDTSGRANMAISGNFLAVVWEDNHTGSPQTYVAYKKLSAKNFAKPIRLSTGKEAYEPCIIALGQDRFAIAWEQDGQIWMQTGSHHKFGQASRLSKKPGRQVSLVEISNNRLLAAWSENEGTNNYIVSAPVSLHKFSQEVGSIKALDRINGEQNQSFPVLGKAGSSIGVVWEDRRRGHTMLVYSVKQDDHSFSKLRVLNDIIKKSDKYGKGSGVTRVALANYGKGQIVATWMDKRNRQTGYDICAALGRHDQFEFGKNQQVQDAFGDNFSQWNPAIAGNQQGDVAIVWYDDREDSMDILLSTKTHEGWSDDLIVPPASGDGDQTNAVIVFDNNRNLHMVWIDQTTNSSPTRLYYTVGRNQ